MQTGIKVIKEAIITVREAEIPGNTTRPAPVMPKKNRWSS